MNFFYFNDCIPPEPDQHLLVKCLENSLNEYNQLKQGFPDEVDGIVTEKEPSSLLLNGMGYSLGDCINDLSDKAKRFAYSVFIKYPIESIFTVANEEEILEEDYMVTINAENLVAINLFLASQNEGMLFTLPVHDDLKVDTINVKGNSSQVVINNLYGIAANTAFLAKLIEDSILKKLGNFDKLLAIVGINTYSERFKKGFDSCTDVIQNTIIEHFQAAKQRNGKTNFFADEELIKNVTPAKEMKISVFELRIFAPVAYRVYFYEAEDRVYLAMVEKKPAPKVQDTHILSSRDIIKGLIFKEG